MNILAVLLPWKYCELHPVLPYLIGAGSIVVVVALISLTVQLWIFRRDL